MNQILKNYQVSHFECESDKVEQVMNDNTRVQQIVWESITPFIMSAHVQLIQNNGKIEVDSNGKLIFISPDWESNKTWRINNDYDSSSVR